MTRDEVQQSDDSGIDVRSQEEQWAREFLRGTKSMAGFDWLGERYHQVLQAEGFPEARVREIAQRLQADTQALLSARELADSYLSQLSMIESRRAREEMYTRNSDEPGAAESPAIGLIARVRDTLGRQAGGSDDAE